MRKKITSCILLSVIMIFSISFSAFAQSRFSDLNEGHWAYKSVMELVENGTVSGFEDGTFRPENTVTRAEFVKMIGKGPTRYENDFRDVSPEHWAYDYIMYSGLAGKGNDFLPSEAITRYDVLILIWTRNGSPQTATAPSIITSQGKNKEAVAWGYTYGIMRGNDGLYLRLDETLTRAEAAELIVRSRSIASSANSEDFTEAVSDKILENFYYSMGLFGDEEYNPDRKLTNGEMAAAVLRLATNESEPSYKGYTIKTPFEHKYAKDIYILGDVLLGQDKITVEFADKYANVQDTLASLTYAAIRQAKNPVAYGPMNNYYKDASINDTGLYNTCITYAYKNGIHLHADGTLRPNEEITVKEFTAIAMQLDYLINFAEEITADKQTGAPVAKGVEIKKSGFTDKYKEFQYELFGLPNEVYLTPFADNSKGSIAKKSFDFAREYSFIFTDMIFDFKSSIEKSANVKLSFSYYPSLVCENGNGGTLRVKCTVLENNDGLSIKGIFKDKYAGELDFVPENGTVFYADIVTGQPITDIILPSDTAVIKQIVYVQK